jgi:hypothetical protein
MAVPFDVHRGCPRLMMTAVYITVYINCVHSEYQRSLNHETNDVSETILAADVSGRPSSRIA